MSNKIVKNWQELALIPDSETHYIKVNLDSASGWILRKENLSQEDKLRSIANGLKPQAYLSTHTFYDSHINMSNNTLKKYGFKVTLKNK